MQFYMKLSLSWSWCDVDTAIVSAGRRDSAEAGNLKIITPLWNFYWHTLLGKRTSCYFSGVTSLWCIQNTFVSSADVLLLHILCSATRSLYDIHWIIYVPVTALSHWYYDTLFYTSLCCLPNNSCTLTPSGGLYTLIYTTVGRWLFCLLWVLAMCLRVSYNLAFNRE